MDVDVEVNAIEVETSAADTLLTALAALKNTDAGPTS